MLCYDDSPSEHTNYKLAYTHIVADQDNKPIHKHHHLPPHFKAKSILANLSHEDPGSGSLVQEPLAFLGAEVLKLVGEHKLDGREEVRLPAPVPAIGFVLKNDNLTNFSDSEKEKTLQLQQLARRFKLMQLELGELSQILNSSFCSRRRTLEN